MASIGSQHSQVAEQYSGDGAEDPSPFTEEDGQQIEYGRENDLIFLLADEVAEEERNEYAGETEDSKQELLYNIDMELESFRSRLLQLLDLPSNRLADTTFVGLGDGISPDVAPNVGQLDGNPPGADTIADRHLGRIPASCQLFPDSTHCSGTPDSGLDSSFLESSGLSSQSPTHQLRCSAPLYQDEFHDLDFNWRQEGSEEELELWHGLVHLLMLASSISLVLQQSEYTV